MLGCVGFLRVVVPLSGNVTFGLIDLSKLPLGMSDCLMCFSAAQ